MCQKGIDTKRDEIKMDQTRRFNGALPYMSTVISSWNLAVSSHIDSSYRFPRRLIKLTYFAFFQKQVR